MDTEQALKLAVVDDHGLFLQGLVHLFGQSNRLILVETFTAATDLLQAVDSNQTFDVILTDLAMKPVNGIALIGALRARDVRTPVIVLSASEDAVTRANSDLVGAFQFIHKSENQDVLLGAVFDAFDAGPLTKAAVKQGAKRSRFTHEGRDMIVQPQIGPQQQRILQMLSTGQTNKEIALVLEISENTVKTHVKAIFREFGVNTRTAAVQRGRELALL